MEEPATHARALDILWAGREAGAGRGQWYREKEDDWKGCVFQGGYSGVLASLNH